MKNNVRIQVGNKCTERLQSPEINKNKLQHNLKDICSVNKSGLIAEATVLYINQDTETLEIDSVSDKLKVKIKPDSGITSDTTGLIDPSDVAAYAIHAYIRKIRVKDKNRSKNYENEREKEIMTEANK